MANGALEIQKYVFNCVLVNYSGRMHKLTYFVHNKADVRSSNGPILQHDKNAQYEVGIDNACHHRVKEMQ